MRKAGTRHPKCPPDQPPFLVARNPQRANNDRRLEVCRHIFVGGYRADVAWWVLNGDSGGDGREYIHRSIVCSIGCAAPLQPHTCRDAAAAREPGGPLPAAGLPSAYFNLVPTLFHIASTRRGIHLPLDRSARRLALRS